MVSRIPQKLSAASLCLCLAATWDAIPLFPDTAGLLAAVGHSGVATSLLSPPLSCPLFSPIVLWAGLLNCLLLCLLPQTDFPQGKDCLISQFTFAFVNTQPGTCSSSVPACGEVTQDGLTSDQRAL